MYDWAAVELHRLRKTRGASHRDVSDILDKDRSLISKIEAGESRLQEGDADKLDLAWDTGGLLGRIIRWAKSRHSSEWRAERAASESKADQIRIWALGWIPVLAQTEDYARAVFVECGRQDVDQAVKVVLERQKILDKDPPPLVWLLIDQDALEHQVGSREVHHAQLARLLELAESPTWTVRLIPRSAGGHVGRDGAFEMYKVGNQDVPYTETLGPGRLVRDASEITQYEVWFRRIGDVAESKRASLALIRRIMEGFA
jgi:transcriptional regulator with XRE-family HTH domain